MARSVTLSDEAFLALREEKREGESDSDVVLRLRSEARAKRKDPWLFFRRKATFDITAEEHEEFLEKMRQADIQKMADLERQRRETPE
jgi:predicted CopG family antitoxin